MAAFIRAFFGWVALCLFWGWNALMVYAIYIAASLGGGVQNLTESERLGRDTGVGIAIIILLITWASGSVVFGLMAHFTRRYR